MSLTTKQVAERLSLTYDAVIAHIKKGNLLASKHGRDWVIKQGDLKRFEATRRPGGKPKGSITTKETRLKMSAAQKKRRERERQK